MAPAKRPSTATKVEAAKKRKVDPVGEKTSAVSRALLEHGTLPASTLSMLGSMAASCLVVPRDERHAFQAEITDMIGEALAGAEEALAKSVEEYKGKVDSTPADKEQRAAACTEAAAALEALRAAAAEKKQAQEEASKALKAARAATAEAKKAQTEGDAGLVETEGKKAALEDATSTLLAPLKERAATTKQDKAALRKLAQIGKEFDFDASMLETLPKAVKKAPAERGSFDALTIGKLEEELATAVANLAKILEEGEPAKAERAAAVAAAEAAQAAADEAEKAAAAALHEAKAAEKAGGTALKEAEKRVKSWLSDTKVVMDTFDEQTATLGKFRSEPLAFYGELKDLVPPPPEPEVPAEAPMEEEAVAPPAEEPAAEKPAEEAPAAPAVEEPAA